MSRTGTTAAPLNYACDGGYITIIKTLIKMGVDINTQDHRKKTPLLIVSERWVLRRIHNDYITAKLLLDAGADPSLTDIEQNNALFTAAKCGHKGLLEIILQKQDRRATPHTRSPGGLTPLHAASQHRSCNNVKLLLDWGADIDARVQRGIRGPDKLSRLFHRATTGKTALMCAIISQDHRSIELLVRSGADINRQDDQGRTALHQAIKRDAHTTSVLLKAGAKLNTKDNKGKTPIDWAITDTAPEFRKKIPAVLLRLRREQISAVDRSRLEARITTYRVVNSK